MSVFDFIFEKNNLDRSNLCQGDILRSTSELKAHISKAHRYYAEAEDYHYFMVLTQSCDLVRRGAKEPKSRYITIAAMRPLSILLKRIIHKYTANISGFPIKIGLKEQETQARQFLERLLHNTEKDVFFVRKTENIGLAEDYCVFLSLSIALRVDHYESCLDAKIAQLSDVFQAKVGWLAGNIYSRVGTPDFEEFTTDAELYKEEFFQEVMGEETVWFSKLQRDALKKRIKADKPKNIEEAKIVAQEIGEEIEYVADRILNQLKQHKLVDEKEKELLAKIRNLIIGDHVLKTYFR